MQRTRLPCFLALTFVLVLVGCNRTKPTDRKGQWDQDLDYLRHGLSARGVTLDWLRGVSTRGQKDFNALYPHFDTDTQTIRISVPQLSDEEVALSLMKVIAGAHVAHNMVQVPTQGGFAKRLSVGLYWYPDGLAVTTATAPFAAALGTRVIRIGNLTPEQALANTAPYISYENNVWLRQQFSSFVTYEPVLRHLGPIDAGGWVTLTLQRLNGEIFTMPIPLADRSASLVSYMDALHVPVPLFKMHPDKYYWSSTLPTAGVVFIQYNTCADDPQQSFTEFSKQVLATIDAISAKRVVIDLRQNGGGNSRIIRPLIAGLRVRQTRHLSVAVLIGPDSFSSAIQNAVELHQELGATLVGEATGGAASGYGEVKTLTLPNSHLIVQYTSKRFNSALDPSATGLSPQVLAPRLWTDALAGRDPALDAALTHGSD